MLRRGVLVFVSVVYDGCRTVVNNQGKPVIDSGLKSLAVIIDGIAVIQQAKNDGFGDVLRDGLMFHDEPTFRHLCAYRMSRACGLALPFGHPLAAWLQLNTQPADRATPHLRSIHKLYT